MVILETPRLALRAMTADDAPFYLALLNTEGWIQNIGDRGIRSVEAARESILNGPVAMHARCGFSLYRAELKADGTPIGMCGLIRRDYLPDADIGYGFLPAYWGQGYAYEAASHVLEHARRDIGLPRLLGMTAMHNAGSIRILEKLGLRFQEIIKTSESDTGTRLYARDL